MKSTIEYIWLDAEYRFRSKCRVINNQEIKTVSDLSHWNYDGSSTGQAFGTNSEIILQPKCLFKDPFRPNDSAFMVICDTYFPDGTPTSTNHRDNAEKAFNKALEEKPWYGLEQEYFFLDPDTGKPLGFPKCGLPRPQGLYYCGIGHLNVYGRDVVEDHLQACLTAGVKISGINAEVAPGQWEFQVGPCVGIEAGDHLLMARYLLERVAETHKLLVEYHPKPITNADINGSGCHINYSTLNMREGTVDKKGLDYIREAVDKLAVRHLEHMKVYGNDNDKRLTGIHETAKYDEFTSGWGNRGASIRIGSDTIINEKGYFEDRRPASNIDPYLATSIIFETTVLNC